MIPVYTPGHKYHQQYCLTVEVVVRTSFVSGWGYGGSIQFLPILIVSSSKIVVWIDYSFPTAAAPMSK